MTRDEAIREMFTGEFVGDTICSRHCEFLLNKIYDHFEPLEKMYNILKQQKEDLIEAQEILIKAHERTIEDYMNRTCSNCKHWKVRSRIVRSNECRQWANNVMTSKDFYCNRWESKDD
jgi:hypothetical protein